MNTHRTLQKTAIALAITNAVAVTTANSAELEEVVVTATKRNANIQDIPMSVTAVTGENLTSMAIENIQDMEKTAPGLKIRDVGNSPRIIIRGAGSAGTTDVAVPIYNDGMYRPRAGQGLASYLDVERVEILRGPQGTLFGRNTLGGLLNVITKKPQTDEFEFGLAATVGDYDLRKFQGFVNVPLNDSIALRISATDTTHDPYVENVFNSDGGLVDADNTYVRAQLQFDINENVGLNLTYSYWSDTANGAGDFGHKVLGVPVNPETQRTNGFTGILDQRRGLRDGWEGGKAKNGSVSNNDPSAFLTDDIREVATDYIPNRDMEEDSFTATLQWDLGFAQLKATGGYFDYQAHNILDGDFSIAGVYDPVGSQSGGWASGEKSSSESTQLDINLSSSGDGPFRWTLGYFNFDEEATYGWIFGDTTAAAPQTVAWAHWLHGSETTADSQAIYGQAEYDITEKLTITAGARYSDDERTSESLFVDLDSLDGTETPTHTKEPQLSWQSVSVREGDDTHSDYRLAVQYNFTDELMVFASIATGYISGATQQGTGELLEPSENDALEIGFKGTFFEGSMQLNATYFDSEYKGLTTSELFLVPGTDLFGSRTVPGGGMEARGVEVELIWQATDQLRITSGLAFNDSEFTDFNLAYRYTEDNGDPRVTTLDNGSKSIDVSGLETPFSPDLSINLGITYEIDLGDRGHVVPGIFLYYSDEYETWPAPYFWTHQDSYSTVDFSATWYSPNDIYTVQAFVNNATDEEYITGSDTFSDERAVVQFNDPRIWGLRLSYNF